MEKINKQSVGRSSATARARKKSYIFSAALASLALGGVHGAVQQAHAGLMTAAEFTFESLANAGTTQSGANSTGVSFGADVGTGTAIGYHPFSYTFTSATGGGTTTSPAGTITATALPTSTVYSNPGGNGTKFSLSANNWTVGDYYEFVVPTTTIDSVALTFSQVSSATGPGVFNLLYSLDGTDFSTFTTYTIPSAPNSAFSSGTSTPNLTLSFDLSSITGLNADPSAAFELQDAATSGYTTTPFSSGTDRIDTIIVSGTAVPEPASLALLSVAAASLMFRRRSSAREE